ncbi:hypothetical protein L1O59_004884 [Salmonella enterica]|nr:hypothetical protein [Salmonella enterica]EBQ9002499.1 hypothetical protein [Salmonella enterica subsp. enterica serovar Blockley]EBS0795542.1 hypothetical protein [Salmonella enterica subsp. enterica serovar Overschie]ECB6428419.1 hypothetical protein [Salmonella enterica subsp. enterica serovar Adelaide]ECD6162066.1 hypothetical protein [Salmonella enterica subsp. enterica]ECU7994682.1 hypothetical protein [Salmonella enterica subsp. enterica serovar Toucra]EID1775591.1 hypothetical prot
MSKEKSGAVSVYISPDIVAALKEKHRENAAALAKVGLTPSLLGEPSIGWMVRFQLRESLGLHISGVE